MEKLITEKQLQDSLELQAKHSTYMPIGEMLIEQKAITRRQINFILNKYSKRARLGDILVHSGIITEEELKAGLKEQKKTGLRLGEILVKLGFVTEKAKREALCKQLNISYIDLTNFNIDRGLSFIINKTYARKHQIVPISKINNTITLAMDDPTNFALIEELEEVTGHSISVVTSTQVAIQDAYNQLYEEPKDKIDNSSIDVIGEIDLEKKPHSNPMQDVKASFLVKKIIAIGVDSTATDIHIETMDQRMDLRFRIDGVLQKLDFGDLQKQINDNGAAIVARIKVLAKLDIAERRRPQDGSFRVKIMKNEETLYVDFRTSIVPGYYGENIVIRILDSRKAPNSIADLNFSKNIYETFSKVLNRNAGIILVTGPTGSGKSSSLYGALGTLYEPGIKILTVEDPIEYVYENITQCEVNKKVGNSFATYIRSFLRQDPEIILIGEIRDSETADMAFKAAQTGHIVLSTMHTIDAVSSVARLLGLNIDPNIISSCLLGVLSQRLARRLCPHCKKEYQPPKELLKEFFKVPPKKISWYTGQKCIKCNYTGYKGRLAVAELWVPNSKDLILINKGASIDELKESSNESTISMGESAMEKLLCGETDLEEVIRVLPYSSIYKFRRDYKE